MSQNIILLIDTSEQACKLALFQSGQVLFEVSHYESRRHGDLLLNSVQSLLTSAQIKPHQLAAIAITTGPGAFTGIRIGVAMAQGLAYGWDIPCISMNTLDLWAVTAFESDSQLQQVIVAMDARMGEVYAAAYQRQHHFIQFNRLLQPICSEVMNLNLDQINKELQLTKALGFIGSGISPYQEAFAKNLQMEVDNIFPITSNLSLNAYGLYAESQYADGMVISPLDLDALYLRPAVIET